MMLSNISAIGWLHTGACLIALVTGLYVLMARKGTRRHRQLGWWYVGSMLVLNLSVFVIYRFDSALGRPQHTGPGIFSIFHWFAVLALASTLLAVFAAIRQRGSRGWAHAHAQAMLGSYYGLVGGLINEMFARVLPLRALALHLSPHAANITQTMLVRMTQTASMLVWLGFALYFAIAVARRHRAPRADSFTMGHPMRYSGGAFLMCIGTGLLLGAFYRSGAGLGWGLILGAALGAFALLRARRAAAPFWGAASRPQIRIMLLAVGGEMLAFFLLGASGFFQVTSPAMAWETALTIVGVHFLVMRWSHGPLMLRLGLCVLAWLGIGHALHLPLPLMAVGDGLIKLVFGFIMFEPLLVALQSASMARTSEGVAPDARNSVSVTD